MIEKKKFVRCVNCAYYSPLRGQKDLSSGECFYNPPIDKSGERPKTFGDDFCALGIEENNVEWE